MQNQVDWLGRIAYESGEVGKRRGIVTAERGKEQVVGGLEANMKKVHVAVLNPKGLDLWGICRASERRSDE